MLHSKQPSLGPLQQHWAVARPVCVCCLSALRFTSKSGFQWGWSLTYSAETEPACLRAQLVHLKSYPLDCTTSILHGHRFHSDFREIQGEAWQSESLGAHPVPLLIVRTICLPREIKKALIKLVCPSLFLSFWFCFSLKCVPIIENHGLHVAFPQF